MQKEIEKLNIDEFRLIQTPKVYNFIILKINEIIEAVNGQIEKDEFGRDDMPGGDE